MKKYLLLVFGISALVFLVPVFSQVNRTIKEQSLNQLYLRTSIPGIKILNKDMLNKKIYVLIFDPPLADMVDSGGRTTEGKDLFIYDSKLTGWYDPHYLVNEIIQFFKIASNGLLNYKVINIETSNQYLEKKDGFLYTPKTFTKALLGIDKFHEPNSVNYNKFIEQFNICEIVNESNIDEFWIFGYAGMGFDEGLSIGPGGFDYTVRSYVGLPFLTYWLGIKSTCKKLVSIMGFNIMAGPDLAIHDFGHKMESIMSTLYDWNLKETKNPWEIFSSNYGIIHAPPDARQGYDYINPQNCYIWGCTGYGFYEWWFYHLSNDNYCGKDGIYNNWWVYFANPELIYYPNSLCR